MLSKAGVIPADLLGMCMQLDHACSADMGGSLAMCIAVGVCMCKHEWSKAAMFAAREPCIVSESLGPAI